MPLPFRRRFLCIIVTVNAFRHKGSLLPLAIVSGSCRNHIGCEDLRTTGSSRGKMKKASRMQALEECSHRPTASRPAYIPAVWFCGQIEAHHTGQSLLSQKSIYQNEGKCELMVTDSSRGIFNEEEIKSSMLLG